MTEVSIIIPCFNRERHIGEAIESALAQSVDSEVIVIDDGSEDRSWDIISAFPSVRAIRTENRGQSVARNSGLAMAKGRFIRFLDSDDRIPVGSVEKMLAVASSLPDKHIAVGEAVRLADGAAPIDSVQYGFSAWVRSGRVPGPLLLGHTLPCWLPLFPRDALNEVGGFNETLGLSEDYELAARLRARGFHFIQVALSACEVREHDGERASRAYGKRGYEEQLVALEQSWIALSSSIEHPVHQDERIAMGQLAWSLARGASRDHFKPEADALFAFARELGGVRSCERSGLPLQILYRFVDPYTAEAIVELVKRLHPNLRPMR